MNFKTEPFKHQLIEFDKIKDKNYFAIFWEMGTGKTKLAIDLIRNKCYQHNKVLKVLVVAPKIALYNWIDEIKMHSSLGAHADVLIGTRYQKLRTLEDKSKKIFIVNYESLVSIIKELGIYKFDCIIVDESQRIKNPKAQCTKAMKYLNQATYKFILSGTPILNNPIDIFSQYLFLDNGLTFGKSYTSFRTQYFIDENAWSRGIPNRKYYPKFILNKLLADLFRTKVCSIASIIKKQDCLDLPPKVYMTHKLEMCPRQLKAYNEMKENLITLVNEVSEDAAFIAGSAAVLLVRLRQISSGFMKLEGTETIVDFEANPKLKAVKEIIADLVDNNKIIIWAWFRHDIELLASELSQYNPAVIYGSTKDRYAEQNKFRKDNTCRIIIAHPKSAGLAINLVEASYAIYYSQGFELENRLQSEDRCHRPGAEIHDKITYIDLVYPKTIDEVILKSLKAKKDLSSSIIQQVNEIMKGGE